MAEFLKHDANNTDPKIERHTCLIQCLAGFFQSNMKKFVIQIRR
jgi:hypothetical protein